MAKRMEPEELAATGIALIVAWLWALKHKDSIQSTVRGTAWRMVTSVHDCLYQNILRPYRSEISRFVGFLLFRTPFTCDCCCLTLGGQDYDAEYVSSQCRCQGNDHRSMYCYQCIATYLENQITDDQASTLVCLNGRRCGLDDRFVRKRLSKRIIAMLDRSQIASAAIPENEKLWRCPSPDCRFVGFISSRTRNASGVSVALSRLFFTKVTRDNRMVRCPACLIASCQFCQKPWTKGVSDHSGLACAAYAKQYDSCNSDQSFDSWKTKQCRFVQNCPACETVIERNDGCNHMTCRCGHEFCWVCGEPWSNQHSYFCRRYRRSDQRPGAANKLMSFFGGWF
jgi:IBR domain, a half RING-finger domain